MVIVFEIVVKLISIKILQRYGAAIRKITSQTKAQDWEEVIAK